MSPDQSGQPSLNFFLLAQALSARIIPPGAGRDEGLGLLAPLHAWRQTRSASNPKQPPMRRPQAYQLAELYNLVCQERGIGPAALLWNKELAHRFFTAVTAQHGAVSRRDTIVTLLDAEPPQARLQPDGSPSRYRVWGRLPRSTPGCEPAIEWALSRIRYTSGVSFTDLLDIICDQYLGQSYMLLARAMAPQWVRELPSPQSAAVLFKGAYDLHKQRKLRLGNSLGDETLRVQEQLRAMLKAREDCMPESVSSGPGLVQLNDGERCLFVCCASDMKTTVSQIVEGTVVYLLARDYWAVNLASLRVGALPLSRVASISSRVQIALARNQLRALRRCAAQIIAVTQPTFNWPVAVVGN